MARCMDMKRNSRGFYTLEAAIFLPLVILTVFSLGYFIKVEGTWERCFYAAIDESTKASLKAYDGISYRGVENKIKERISSDNEKLDYVYTKNFRNMYLDLTDDSLTSYRLEAGMSLNLPLGFERNFEFHSQIKYRNFVGKKRKNNPLGSNTLEKNTEKNPVWVFPNMGEKYHKEMCTYVKTAAGKKILSSRIKKSYSACSICNSKELILGSIVYCFENKGTSYHKGICRSVNKHIIVIDKSDAEKRGYTPCSKCGGI